MSNDGPDLAGAQILIVDDTPTNLKILRQALEGEGYRILVATNGEKALELAASVEPDLILLDVMMPGIDGFETCRRLRERAATRTIPVIFVTAKDETEGVVHGFEAGGIDYITKPFHNEEVLARTRTHLERALLARALAAKNDELEQKNRELQEEIARRKTLTSERNHLNEQLSMISQREAAHWGIDGFVGRSGIVQQSLKEISLLQHADVASVLVPGESGTGKELIARAIHSGSARSSGPFVPVNCSAIPAELAESLLFGHLRGAFTGADAARTGYFELAHGGTLFLDEVGDMAPDLQAKLLRVLEDGVVTPIGDPRANPWTCALSPPPTPIWKRALAPALSVRISTFAWLAIRSTCPLCASAGRI